MSVIIRIDPHKASHTAVAVGGDEREVAKVTVRATCKQTARLLAWAEPFAERTWAIESAGGLGYLLAQQLVEAGEVVLDVPPTLASRVPVLSTGVRRRTIPTTRSRSPSPPCARMASLANPPAGYSRDDEGDDPDGSNASTTMNWTSEESGRPGSNWHHQLGRLRFYH